MNNNFQRVAIYLRLSNEDADKDKKTDSESIKNQRFLLLNEISKRENFILVDEYCDEDLSGAGTYRPEFERLIKDCESGKIDIVLCKSQSRFSRDLEIIEKYLHNKFLEWNVRFIGLVDNADTNNFGNKKARQINGLVNEWYLEDVSNNIRSAFKAKMLKGEFISPFAPFGYEVSKNNNNQLVVDSIASIIVKKIYSLYLNGMGFSGIANYLNSTNTPSPSFYKYQKGLKLYIHSNHFPENIKWSSNTIKTILTNEVYIGNLIQGKRTTISYKNHKIKTKEKQDWIRSNQTHPPIISEELFYKVQDLIKKRKRQLKKKDFVHIFSGKVYCLECGSYMKKKNSSKHQYLVCSNNKNCLNKSSIRYDQLETIIFSNIHQLVNKYYSKKNIINFFNSKYINKKIEVLNKKKLLIEKELKKKNQYIKSLYEDKFNKKISEEDFNYLYDIYRKEKSYLNLDFIENQLTDCRNHDYANIKFIYNDNFSPYSKMVIDEFIDEIYIGKLVKVEEEKRNILIKWKLKEE